MEKGVLQITWKKRSYHLKLRDFIKRKECFRVNIPSSPLSSLHQT